MLTTARNVLLVCMIAGVVAVAVFLLVYDRYLYDLPESVARGIPGEVSVADSRYRGAIEQGRRFARKHLHDWNLPSFSLAVGKDGKTVWVESFGYADVENQIPAQPDMAYRIHSVSKPLTAMALAHLWEQDYLDLEVPIEEYEIDFPKKRYYFSVRQLLSHQAGIRHYGSDEEVFNKTHYRTLNESLSVFRQDSLLFEPGTAVSYSSYGYNLAGAVAEEITQTPFTKLMHELVFNPLEMRHTGFEEDSLHGMGMVKYYEMGAGGRRYEAPYIDLSVKNPSGGMLSTPEDLVVFGLALLDSSFLQAETFLKFTARQHTSIGEETRYGLGWELSSPVTGWKKWLGDLCGLFGWYIPHTVGLTPMIFHQGGSAGGMSILVIYPDQHIVFAFVSNINGELPPVYKMPMMAAEGFFDYRISIKDW